MDERYIYHARDKFLALKDKIYGLYRDNQRFEYYVKKNTLTYLDEFFRILDDKNSFKRKNILDQCRTQ